MAFKNLMKGKSDAADVVDQDDPAKPTSAPRTKPKPRMTSFIDASTKLEGTLRCSETLRIDGQLTGTIECEDIVRIGEDARIQADIEALSVQISGEVDGNIAARRKITLDRTARVNGDLATPGIVIEEGAQLKGRIVIGSDSGSEAKSVAGKRSDVNPAQTVEST